MLDEYLRQGQGFIIVYSIVSNQSFLEVQNFKDKLWLCKDLKPNDTIPILVAFVFFFFFSYLFSKF